MLLFYLFSDLVTSRSPVQFAGLLAGTDIVLKIAEQHAALYVRLLFYNC